ncbi:MAG: AarF/ABC1/UbiB kinase family protein [Caldilineae bacterium]|nr:AarF/ABC1/UbiB kinase family protein [Caldilineae bacterium]
MTRAEEGRVGDRDAAGAVGPVSVPARLARMGRAGAVIAGREAAGRLREAGETPERRGELAEARAQANATTLLEAAGELRGLAAKLGQLLAQEGQGLPPAFARGLASLQRSAPPMHASLARLRARQALGDWPEAIFARWEPRPFAAASLGQVHRAWLADGRALAVKLQYPDIRRAVESDFRLLEQSLMLLRLAGRDADAMGRALDHLRQRILAETDYRAEADQLEFFARALADRADLAVPGVDRAHSGETLLSMDFLSGQPLDEWLADGPSQAQRDALGRRLLALFFVQAFELRRFHADPHPGNLLVRADGGIGLVDFGCVETLGRGQADEVRELYRIPIDDAAGLDAQYRRLGLYAATDPDARAKRAALLALQRANVGRFHAAGAWDFGRAEPMRELAGCLREVARLGIASGPLVLFERSQFGLYGLLHQIGARVDCRQVITPFLAG